MEPRCAVALDSDGRMSALPMAKVKVATRKHNPTRPAVPFVDIPADTGAARVPTDVAGVRPVDRSSVAIVMVTPFIVFTL
jgi:hypothetical protein